MNNIQMALFTTQKTLETSTIESFKQKFIDNIIESLKRQENFDADDVVRRLKELACLNPNNNFKYKPSNIDSYNYYTNVVDAYIGVCKLYERYYIPWHTNKYYPDITVDNLKQWGVDKFYEIAMKAERVSTVPTEATITVDDEGNEIKPVKSIAEQIAMLSVEEDDPANAMYAEFCKHNKHDERSLF